jgi:hypothetical protein
MGMCKGPGRGTFISVEIARRGTILSSIIQFFARLLSNIFQSIPSLFLIWTYRCSLFWFSGEIQCEIM